MAGRSLNQPRLSLSGDAEDRRHVPGLAFVRLDVDRQLVEARAPRSLERQARPAPTRREPHARDQLLALADGEDGPPAFDDSQAGPESGAAPDLGRNEDVLEHLAATPDDPGLRGSRGEG